jgi:hypothetical protein
VINELGQALFERAKMERGEANRANREKFLRQAVEAIPENPHPGFREFIGAL